jgi:hypothetical protein
LATPGFIVDGTHIKFFLLGDAGYPSRTYLLRNYKPAEGDVDKIRFDKQINGGRVSIENAFGLLKMRWRILISLNSRVDTAHVYSCRLLCSAQLLSAHEGTTSENGFGSTTHGERPTASYQRRSCS